MEKCEYAGSCRLFDEFGTVCTETGGMYYADGTMPAGCYRERAKKKLKKKKRKREIESWGMV